MGDDDVFTAERITNKRTINGVTHYCIKWKGYSSRDNTWEPVENIIDPGLLIAFEKREAKKIKRAPVNDADDRENSVENPPAATSSSPAIEPTTTTSSSRSTATSFTLVTPTYEPAPTPSPTVQLALVKTPPVLIDTTVTNSPTTPKATPIVTPNVTPKVTPISAPKVTPKPTPNKVLSNHSHSKFAILNTVITDVTVNDQTITISESKTNQGFFREVGRHSVAVDTTHSNNDFSNMIE